MKRNGSKMRTLLVLVVAAVFGLGLAAPAAGGKPAHAGGGKEKQSKSNKSYKGGDSKGNKGKKSGADWKGHKHFGDHDRDVVRNYYQGEFRKGKGCPPGLAKKNNGCMPPGQAKKRWSYGQPLPRDVVFYDLPRQLVIQLPAPPDGARYVRVASDILLIAIGTGMVIDAIDSLTSL